MTIDEKPVLSVNNLTVRYGRGCEKCRTHLEKTDVLSAVRSGRQIIFHLTFIPEKYLELSVKAVPASLRLCKAYILILSQPPEKHFLTDIKMVLKVYGPQALRKNVISKTV